MIAHQNNKPTGEYPKGKEQSIDLHRAYRAMIREILRRQLLKPVNPPTAKEESHD